jgi:Zn-finger nucleic acid-binding protein
MADKQGIEIDYCPKCRGIWLDRGELDKIIERSAAYEKDNQKNYYPGHNDHHDKHQGDHHYGKRKSLLSELFD